MKFLSSISILLFLLCVSLSANSFDLYLVRHFEKQPAATATDGDVSLTPKGEARASELVRFFNDKSLENIYSTQYKRTNQSITPTAKSKSLKIEHYDPAQLEVLAQRLLRDQKNSLVAGHSNTTGVLYKHLGCEEVEIGHNDYGTLFIASIDGQEISCHQVIIPPKAQ